MFVTGTAVTVVPVESLSYKDVLMKAAASSGEITLELRNKLQDIQV